MTDAKETIMLRRLLLATVMGVVVANGAIAQDKPKPLPGDEMIYKYLCAETDKLSKRFMDGAKTLDEWNKKLPRLKREYMDMLGLWPIPEKAPLKATVTGQIEAHGVVVEKIHYQSKSGLYVTANLYRPKASRERKRPEKLPAILYVCGHSGRGRDGNKTAFQDHGFWFANNGYVCLIVDTLQLGEIPGVHHGTYGRPWGHLKAWGETDAEKMKNHNRFGWWSAGYTPAGVEAWNGICGIDYLLTRPEVDPDRIGVTGISGGGAATFWIAAADERVKVAVPVSGMSDLESYVKNRIVNGHCDCMFLYNTYQWDWTTIAALVAPRPMLFANSDNDAIFPMDGNRRIIAKLRDCYKMHGKPELVDEYVSVGGHDYRPDLRIAIFKFINKHLKGDTTTPVEDSAKYTPLPGKDLRVFATDADLPKDAINGRIDETFVPRGKVELPRAGQFAAWKSKLIGDLKARAFRPHLAEYPESETTFVAGDVSRSFQTEPPIEVSVGFIPGSMEGKIAGQRTFPLVVYKEGELPFWYRHHRYVTGLGMTPRGYGRQWTRKSPPNYVERAHVLLGRTLDEGRVLDVVVWLRESVRDFKKDEKMGTVIGQGQAGIIAAYAALFEPRVAQVIVIDPPKSHMEGPHFLGIRKVLDIPEALGLLAPTPLTIIGGNDPAFDRTAEIYRLAGAAGKLTRK
jgi:cephalosporin-C deacetylase-like acetyl esterase